MAWYYSGVMNEKRQLIQPPTGPLSTYSHAVDVHAKYEMQATQVPFPSGWPLHSDERRVLLDVGSVATADDHEMRQLILHDPVLHAVFQLGRMSAKAQPDKL